MFIHESSHCDFPLGQMSLLNISSFFSFLFFFSFFFFFYVFADMGEYFVEKSFTSDSSERKEL